MNKFLQHFPLVSHFQLRMKIKLDQTLTPENRRKFKVWPGKREGRGKTTKCIFGIDNRIFGIDNRYSSAIFIENTKPYFFHPKHLIWYMIYKARIWWIMLPAPATHLCPHPTLSLYFRKKKVKCKLFSKNFLIIIILSHPLLLFTVNMFCINRVIAANQKTKKTVNLLKKSILSNEI